MRTDFPIRSFSMRKIAYERCFWTRFPCAARCMWISTAKPTRPWWNAPFRKSHAKTHGISVKPLYTNSGRVFQPVFLFYGQGAFLPVLLFSRTRQVGGAGFHYSSPKEALSGLLIRRDHTPPARAARLLEAPAPEPEAPEIHPELDAERERAMRMRSGPCWNC